MLIRNTAYFFAAIFLLLASQAYGEIIRTLDGVFQTTQRTGKVIVTQEPPGIFALLSSPIELQLFDPATLPKEDALHLFLTYSPELDRYTALSIGAKQFRIKGGLTLVMRRGADLLRIAIDNSNPYASFLFDSQESGSAIEPSLLGFRGTQLVVNVTGQNRVALTEANQFNRFKELLDPYLLMPDGQLTVKSQAVNTTSLGVDLEPQRNIPCLKAGAVFLPREELQRIRQARSSETSAHLLEQIMSAQSNQDPFKGLLLLRVEPTEMIGLDYSGGYTNAVVKIFRPFSRAPARGKPLCVVEDVQLEE